MVRVFFLLCGMSGIFLAYCVSAAYNVTRVANTYAWIRATALSKVVRIIGVILSRRWVVVGNPIIKLLSSDIRRCPAIIFAVRRTHSVMGRIRFLVISIRTMKFISIVGVPWGTVWAITILKWFVSPKTKVVAHRSTANGKLMVRWAVAALLSGNRATAFRVNTIIIKVEITLTFPFLGG